MSIRNEEGDTYKPLRKRSKDSRYLGSGEMRNQAREREERALSQMYDEPMLRNTEYTAEPLEPRRV